VKLMTDGILLAELQHDRLLSAYDTIIIDEAHERSLNVDFLLGYLRQLLPRRPDLKLVITSATIDVDRIAREQARLRGLVHVLGVGGGEHVGLRALRQLGEGPGFVEEFIALGLEAEDRVDDVPAAVAATGFSRFPVRSPADPSGRERVGRPNPAEVTILHSFVVLLHSDIGSA